MFPSCRPIWVVETPADAWLSPDALATASVLPSRRQSNQAFPPCTGVGDAPLAHPQRTDSGLSPVASLKVTFVHLVYLLFLKTSNLW